MDEQTFMNNKLDPELVSKLKDDNLEPLKVIVQTEDGLTSADTSLIKTLGGKIKDDLYIINAFSADIPAEGLKKLILSPRVVRIFNDGKVGAM